MERDFWIEARDCLIKAVEQSNRRGNKLCEALGLIAEDESVWGSALISPVVTPSQVSSRVMYEGTGKDQMRHWLWTLAAGNSSLGNIEKNLEKERTPHLPEDAKPRVEYVLDDSPPPGGRPSERGLWVLWPRNNTSLDSRQQNVETFLQGLETLLEVEHTEHRLDDPLVRVAEDGVEIITLLSKIKFATKADLVYFATAEDGFLSLDPRHVSRGANDPSHFKFQFRVGIGVGGTAFDEKRHQTVTDCKAIGEERYEATEIPKKEGIQSLIAYPLYSQSLDTGGVFYVAWRTRKERFDAALALIRYVTKNIDLPSSWKPDPLPPFGDPAAELKEKKSKLLDLMLHSNKLSELEHFLQEVVEGPAIVVNSSWAPCVPTRKNELDVLQHSPAEREIREKVLLPDDRGWLLLWPSVEFPPNWWPELPEQAATTSNLIQQRREEEPDVINRRRAGWIKKLIDLEGGSAKGWKDYQELLNTHRHKELGIFTWGEPAEVWAISWAPQTKAKSTIDNAKHVALERLHRPLTTITYEGVEVGVILVTKKKYMRPQNFQKRLREIFGPDASVWLVHGASYDSLEGLSDALNRALRRLNRLLRDKGDERHVVEVNSESLEDLLTNLEHSLDFNAFADKVLQSLSNHDDDRGSIFTMVLCHYLLVSDKPAQIAKDLKNYERDKKPVGENAIRYRLEQAQKKLSRSLDYPPDKAELTLAAYLRYRRDHPDLLHPRNQNP